MTTNDNFSIPSSSRRAETPLLDFYNGRSILILGGSGLAGTALIYKLVTCTKVAQIYVLIRGGEEYV